MHIEMWHRERRKMRSPKRGTRGGLDQGWRGRASRPGASVYHVEFVSMFSLLLV